MRRRVGFTLIELLVVLAIIAVLLSLLVSSIMGAREASRRINCVNNLKQIDLALQTYISFYGVLPSGSYNPTGPVVSRPEAIALSWIYSMLPYMEQSFLYKATDPNFGPFDAANRTAQLTRMSTLLCPNEGSPGGRSFNWRLGTGVLAGTPPPPIGPGVTSYVGCHNDAEAPIDVDNHGVVYLNSRVSVVDVADGMSQTIFVGEVARPSPLGWLSGTRAALRNTGHPINRVTPGTLKSPTGQPIPIADGLRSEELDSQINSGTLDVSPTYVGGFGSSHLGGGSNFAFGDGSVRFIKETIAPTILQRLGNRDDGEQIDEGDL